MEQSENRTEKKACVYCSEKMSREEYFCPKCGALQIRPGTYKEDLAYQILVENRSALAKGALSSYQGLKKSKLHPLLWVVILLGFVLYLQFKVP